VIEPPSREPDRVRHIVGGQLAVGHKSDRQIRRGCPNVSLVLF
jgi:hypothetical protein